MIIRLFTVAIFFFLFNFQACAGNNPFAREVVVDVGLNSPWHIKDGVAVKTSKNFKGQYFHLIVDKSQLRLTITRDKAGKQPVMFDQFGVIDIQVDGSRLPLFTWCLNHQEQQNRFLRQGLQVKNDVCEINGNQGEFILQMNNAILGTLEQGKSLSFIVRPYRMRLRLNYDLADFRQMSTVLLAKPVSQVSKIAVKKQIAPVKKQCWAKPPAKYSKINAKKYDCHDSFAKKVAESQIFMQVKKLVLGEKQKVLAQRKRLKAAQARKQHELETKRKKQETLHQQQVKNKREAAAIANSVVKRSEISDEITSKMVGMCRKIWNTGANRCYCQKYIKFAPAGIKPGPTCK